MPAAQPALSDTDLDDVTDFVWELAAKTPGPSGPRSDLTSDPLTAAIQAAGFQPVPPRAAPAMSRFVRTDNHETTSLESFRGQPVLLHFWGTSCAHCLADFPAVVDLADACRPDGLNWLSVCADEEDAAAIEQVARDRIGTHAVYSDESGLAIHQFQVQILPTFILIDAEGQVIAARTGGIQASPAQLSRLVGLCKATKR
jgi:thiol-disulfide isomerase/thioredoxin